MRAHRGQRIVNSRAHYLKASDRREALEEELIETEVPIEEAQPILKEVWENEEAAQLRYLLA